MAEIPSLYNALSPAAQRVALALGVAYPNFLTSDQVADILQRPQLWSAGSQFVRVQYKAACAEATKAGVATTEHGGALSAVGHWAPWLTLQAFRENVLEGIEDGYRAQFQRHWMGARYEREFQMRLRAHTIAGRFDRIRVLGDMEEEDWHWLILPGVAHLLPTLPGDLGDQAFTACFDRVVQTATAPEPILEAWGESGDRRAGFASEVAYIRVLQGAHQDAFKVFEDLPDDLRATKPVRTGLASTRALVAMLRGQHTEAIRFIDEAIASERSGTRKRNVFPPSERLRAGAAVPGGAPHAGERGEGGPSPQGGEQVREESPAPLRPRGRGRHPRRRHRQLEPRCGPPRLRPALRGADGLLDGRLPRG